EDEQGRRPWLETAEAEAAVPSGLAEAAHVRAALLFHPNHRAYERSPIDENVAGERQSSLLELEIEGGSPGAGLYLNGAPRQPRERDTGLHGPFAGIQPRQTVFAFGIDPGGVALPFRRGERCDRNAPQFFR